MNSEFLQTSNPRTVGMMLIIIVFLVVTIQVLYLLWPQIKAYRELDNRFFILQQAAVGQDGLEEQLSTTRTEVEELSYQLHGDMAGLPDNQMESYIIGRLQKISWNTDVELASIIPGKGRQVQSFQETLFNVKIHASYFDFFQWLQRVNQELGYIVVKRFEISPIGRQVDDSKPKLNISLILVSYRMVNDG
ncbi:MAG: type 4a pilus biogenesis protein PilO [Gammaproteobacteria bacterium]|nr:type 4a pilus biogenesis protein PilO [Gammaproteobacteria bacterium]